jgi:DNA polymerase-3 subunit gamma/tau
MFERLNESQGEIAKQLANQIEKGTFSQVNLFGGNRYSLRMTAALDTARFLSCLGDRTEQCRCESCRRFELLTTTNVVIVSQRDNNRVIETAINSFVRLRNDFSRYFLIKNTRIFLLQYHLSLMSGSQTQSQSANYDNASSVNDLLMDLSALKSEISEKEAKSIAQALRSALKPLFLSAKRNTTITVNQVRALEEWVNETSARSEKRFIIIESLEQANASARNSLLKMLEEPPKDVYFTLISEYPGRIMQTILSRVRRYSFPPLKEETVQALLSPFFLGNQKYSDLEQFFLQGGGLDLAKANEQVSLVTGSLFGKKYLRSQDFNELLAKVDESDSYEYLLKGILSSVEQQFIEGNVSFDRARSLETLVSSSLGNALRFNQNKKLMFEALYYSMMELQ